MTVSEAQTTPDAPTAPDAEAATVQPVIDPAVKSDQNDKPSELEHQELESADANNEQKLVSLDLNSLLDVPTPSAQAANTNLKAPSATGISVGPESDETNLVCITDKGNLEANGDEANVTDADVASSSRVGLALQDQYLLAIDDLDRPDIDRVFADDAAATISAANFTEGERKHNMVIAKLVELESRNKALVTQLKASQSALSRQRTVNDLKIRERTVLLTELSTQVNDLRAELSRKNIAIQLQQRAPRVRTAGGGSSRQQQRVSSPNKTGMVARLDPAEEDHISATQAQVSLSPTRMVTLASVGGPASPQGVHDPQKLAQSISLQKLAPDNEASWVISQFARERPVTSSSLPQLRRTTFSASGGQYGALDNPLNTVEGVSERLSTADGSYGMGSDGDQQQQRQQQSQGEIDLNWLGAKPEVTKEISLIRERLVQHIADSMNASAMKEKPHFMASKKARDLAEEGRAARLKDIQEKKKALYDIGKKAISKHRPKKVREDWY